MIYFNTSTTTLSDSESELESWPLNEEIIEAQDDEREGELNPQMIRALIMLVEGKKTADIAAELHVHRTTVYRWTTHPVFQRELNLYRDRLIEEAFSLQVLDSKRAALR